MPVAAALGVDDLDAVLLERAGQREDVAHVVVDDQHLAALPARRRSCADRMILLIGSGSLAIDRCRNRAVSSSSCSGESMSLTMQSSNAPVAAAVSSASQVLPGVDDDRQVARRPGAAMRSISSKPGRSPAGRDRGPRSRTGARCSASSAARRCRPRSSTTSAVADQRRDARALRLVVLDRPAALRTGRSTKLFSPRQRVEPAPRGRPASRVKPKAPMPERRAASGRRPR